MTTQIVDQKDMMNMFESLALNNIPQAQSTMAESRAFGDASYAKNASHGGAFAS